MALMADTRIVRRKPGGARALRVDVCVMGAGIAGVSAAIESARLGRSVALVDAAPALGGQAVGSVIGTFCGVYSNGRRPYQTVHGIFDDILRDLGAAGALHPIEGRRNTRIVQYDEVALARWVERTIQRSGIHLLLGAMLGPVRRDGARLGQAVFHTRYGDVAVDATGFIDASGDAALAYAAGFACREPEETLYGTQMMVLEGIDEAAVAAIDRRALQQRLEREADAHGLRRHDGFVFAVPGKGRCLINMTHIETPLEAFAASRMAIDGREQADRLVGWLRSTYPAAFGAASVRTYGMPGIRQTRWIAGRHHLTADEVRAGVRFDDAIARCSWPIELHNRADGVHWEEFGDDHMHYVPLRSLTPEGADNLLAAGRCIDGDPAALSSVRVMGPCVATGAAAAHALDLAGSGSVSQIDLGALQRRLHDNLNRRD
jgi:glycine/D-amino acid oxidase-like deaminating enzyme